MIGDPMKNAQAAARPTLPKRFYKEVSVRMRRGEGAELLLDDRPVRTPGRNPLVLPKAGLAEAVAAEWRAQPDVIDPATMPLTRLVNTALDGVEQAMEPVRADIVRYAGADLVCYRAEGPQGLVDRQTEQWDPLVRWARDALGVDLVLAEGVMHVPQSDAALDRVEAELAGFDALLLAALHVMTSLTGSAVIALAIAKGRIPAAAGWEAAHIDEDWQISQWGEDAEAARRRAFRWREMEAASRVIELLRD